MSSQLAARGPIGGETPGRWWRECLLALAGLVLTALITFLAVSEPRKAIELAVLGLLTLAVLFVLAVIDVALLPAISLAAFALIPIQYLPVSTHDAAFSPALLAVLILVLRARGRPIAGGPHLLPLLILSVWVLVATIISPLRSTSALWSINFLVLVAVPVLWLPGWREGRRRLEDCWLALGGVLGAYALVELALRRNPLLDSLYHSGATPLTQTWSVYRVTTTLGHPLTNGTFFALAVLLGIGRVLRGSRGWTLVATVLAGIGLAGSASRGPALALAAGLGLTLTVIVLQGRDLARYRGALVAIPVVLLVGVPLGLYLSQRSSSGEAAGSTLTRDATYQSGLLLVKEHPLTGSGPGIADELKREAPTGQASRGIESSALELAIGLGIPGFLLAAWLMLTGGLSALTRRPELAGCVLTYTVAAATYNLLDANRPALLLWGVVLGLAIRPEWPEPIEDRGAVPPRPDQRAPRPSAPALA